MHEADAELLAHFERTRNKTLELVACVPEDWLERTPPGEARPLYQLLAHTGCGEAFWLADVLRDGQDPSITCGPDLGSLRSEIERYRDRTLAFFRADDGRHLGEVFRLVEEDGCERSWTGRNRLLYFVDHEVHHRGKIVLALVQMGLTDLPFMPF